MSGEQLIVLALLGVAFAVGWIARGDGRAARGSPEGAAGERAAYLRALIEDAQAALDRAVSACAPALAIAEGSARGDVALSAALDVVDRATATLAPLADRLHMELGDDHPLTEEFDDAAAAVDLVQSWLSSGATPADAVTARGLHRAARDALGRFRRIGRAVTTA